MFFAVVTSAFLVSNGQNGLRGRVVEKIGEFVIEITTVSVISQFDRRTLIKGFLPSFTLFSKARSQFPNEIVRECENRRESSEVLRKTIKQQI